MPDSLTEDAHTAPPASALRWLKLGAVAVGVAAVVLLYIAASQPELSTRPEVGMVAFTARPVSNDGWLPVESLLELPLLSASDRGRLLKQIEEHWRDGYTPMLLEAARPGTNPYDDVMRLLRKQTALPDESDSDAVRHELWRNPVEPHPEYASFKAQLYRWIDPRFAAYFQGDPPTTIRLDEVRWGGVKRDGIPPLDKPEMLTAKAAGFLADSDVVFGIEINGDARAYPKRILAWHEMFKDTVGGVSLCGVYCTLCGMVIPYETEFEGVHYELGTSGFLYRSNKLMYDHATESMWSTTDGEPVIGSLVGKGIKLKTRSVVTTTWGEWRRRHPQTTVLSLNTGHSRDYREGAAYRRYFATDRLMFTVPELPTHPNADELPNKGEVLALRFGDAGPLAIRADFLARTPVYQSEHGGQRYVVVTDPSGANRVYDAGERDFAPHDDGPDALQDESGGRWIASEGKLTGPNGATLPRLSAHRAFWFGWRAAYPDTALVGG